MASSSASQIALDLDVATALRRELETSAALQAALGDTTPNLLELGPASLARVQAARAQRRDELVLLGIERQMAQRALDALERTDLLPPTPDVERVRDGLRAGGIEAHPALAYLAENAPSRARELIAANPELAAGVVVFDLERAAKVLVDPPPVDAPVAVGLAGALLEARAASKCLVVPPRAATFDRTSAAAEREARGRERESRALRTTQVEKAAAELDQVGAKLEQFVARNPASWFSAKERERAAYESRRLKRDEDAAQAEHEAGELKKAADAARQVAKAARRRAKDLESSHSRVQIFIARGGSTLGALLSKRSVLEQEIETIQRHLASLQTDANTVGAQIEEARRALDALEEEIKALRADRGVAGQFGDGSPGEVLELEAARARFQILKDRYEQKTSNAALKGQIDELTKKIADGIAAMEKAGRSRLITVTDARAALAQAKSSVGLAEAQRRAEEAVGKSQGKVKEADREEALATQELKTAATNIKTMRDQGREKHVAEFEAECAEWDLARLISEKAQAEEAVKRDHAEEDAAKLLMEQADGEAHRARTEAEKLEGWLQRLDDSRAATGSQIAQAGGEPRPLLDLAAVGAAVDATVTALQDCGRVVAKLSEKAELVGRRLAKFAAADAQASLPTQIRDRLAEPELQRLLDRSADHLQDIEQRALVVHQELAEIERHRGLLAQELQSATDPALRQIRRLENASVFPASVAIWGERPFIKVRANAPESAAERDAIAANLLDRLVAMNDIPSGPKLIKLAVRDLCRGGLAVSILKPEPQRRLAYEPIDRLRAFSRGEQLTAAILLYCTLAKLRAHARGNRQSPTSVLFLDNPLGTCSNPALVELQRDLARCHGVQLVYTTGIEDLEALRLLPCKVRLRNAHVDVRGRRRVTLEQDDVAPIDAVRVVAGAHE